MKKRILGLALAMLLLFCAAALSETNTQVKHYLMLGEDGYADRVTDDARTDTIVLMSLDTKYNRVILTSILRDSKISNPRGNGPRSTYSTKIMALTASSPAWNANSISKSKARFSSILKTSSP